MFFVNSLFNKIKIKMRLVFLFVLLAPIQIYGAFWTPTANTNINANTTYGSSSGGTNGGGIYNNGYTLNFGNASSVINIIFSGNIANAGGAIYSNGGAVNFGLSASQRINLYLDNNRSNSGNGIMPMLSGNTINFNVNILRAVDNYSSGGGVVLYFNKSYASVNIASMTLLRNSVSNANGGAILASGSGVDVTINGDFALISSNTIANGSSRGGAFGAENGARLNINISSMTVDSNKAGRDGGQMIAWNGGKLHFINIRYMRIANGLVSDGANPATSSGWGGGIYLGNEGSTRHEASFTLQSNGHVIFENNTAAMKGGAINAFSAGGGSLLAFNNGTVTFKDNKVLNNGSAGETGNGWGLGGAIFIGYHNVATNYHAEMTFSNEWIYFTNNYASHQGGGIFVDTRDGNASNHHQLTFTNSTMVFTGNESPEGAAIYQGAGILTITGGAIEFINNYSSLVTSIGNVALGANATMSLSNIYSMIARGNRAGQAGFLYIPNNSFNFTGAMMELTGNTAFNGRGGGFYFTNSTTVFSGQNMTFKTNTALTASGYGGAIYIESSNATFGAPLSMIFDGNSAGGSGGGMYFLNSRAYFTQSNSMQFLNNIAATNGGAMYFGNSYASFA
ncbi:MAG: hypothetical protein LBV16_05025, partial [Elusimicrobiota bacterium]|nr:hypothetical protein [Elusimicrobiota bacterium]